MKARSLLWLLPLVASASPARAYVTYNRLGYVSCSACHFVPTGGGLLTPYGESVGSAMAAVKGEYAPPERVAYGGVQARMLQLDSSSRANPFLMQADLLGTVQPRKDIRVDAIAGLNLKMAQSDFISVPSGWDAWILRRALVSVDTSDKISVSAGRDAAVAGINIDDHTAFLRSTNRRGIEDTPTQLRVLYQGDELQLLPYLELPSYEETAENREYGTGLRAEYLLNTSNSVGATFLYGNTPAISRLSSGVFARLSHDHWNGVVSEAVFTWRNVHASQQGFGQGNFYVRPYVAVPEWVETSLIFEYLSAGEPFAQTGSQFGPEVNVRLHRMISVIGDGRDLTLSGHSEWSWYGQIFLHVQI
jgi:hypothetical protein